MSGRAAAALILLVAAAAATLVRLTPSAGAASAPPTWSFAIEEVEDHSRGAADSFFGFLLDVDAEGAVVGRRIFRVPGGAPGFEDLPDNGRYYDWRILGRRGEQLASGRHFDLTALYTQNEAGGCDKSLVGDHSMMVRTPAPLGAHRFEISLVAARSDLEQPR